MLRDNSNGGSSSNDYGCVECERYHQFDLKHRQHSGDSANREYGTKRYLFGDLLLFRWLDDIPEHSAHSSSLGAGRDPKCVTDIDRRDMITSDHVRNQMHWYLDRWRGRARPQRGHSRCR